MPNTIAHFAVNGLISRALISNADLKWIYLACVIPDIPWILQRILRSLPLSLDLYDIRAYCIAQSSFLICIFLCLAFAYIAKQKGKVFIILILGCLLHLLVDALQIKWANGVQLFAPANWQLFRFDFFWPESLGTYLLTTAGLLYFLIYFRKAIQPNCEEFKLSYKTISVSTLFAIIWLALPVLFISSIYQADNHYIATLKDVQNRAGKSIEIDRNIYVRNGSRDMLKTSYGEMINLVNIEKPKIQAGDKISLQGTFTDKHTIDVSNYHKHSSFRDYASMLGLVCVLFIWLIFTARCILNNQTEA